jgi:hypothetical protein
VKDEAVGELVGTLCDRYGKTPTDDLVTLWWNSFHETPQPVIDAALADYLASESWMPLPAKFREYIDKASRAARRIEPRRTGCQTCDGNGWKESTRTETAVSSQGQFTYPAGVFPCPECEPERHDRWRTQWIPEAKKLQPVKTPDLLPANPRKGLATARAALAAADGLTRNGADL